MLALRLLTSIFFCKIKFFILDILFSDKGKKAWGSSKTISIPVYPILEINSMESNNE